jgi:hypothetical protein
VSAIEGRGRRKEGKEGGRGGGREGRRGRRGGQREHVYGVRAAGVSSG